MFAIPYTCHTIDTVAKLTINFDSQREIYTPATKTWAEREAYSEPFILSTNLTPSRPFPVFDSGGTYMHVICPNAAIYCTGQGVGFGAAWLYLVYQRRVELLLELHARRVIVEYGTRRQMLVTSEHGSIYISRTATLDDKSAFASMSMLANTQTVRTLTSNGDATGIVIDVLGVIRVGPHEHVDLHILTDSIHKYIKPPVRRITDIEPMALALSDFWGTSPRVHMVEWLDTRKWRDAIERTDDIHRTTDGDDIHRTTDGDDIHRTTDGDDIHRTTDGDDIHRTTDGDASNHADDNASSNATTTHCGRCGSELWGIIARVVSAYHDVISEECMICALDPKFSRGVTILQLVTAARTKRQMMIAKGYISEENDNRPQYTPYMNLGHGLIGVRNALDCVLAEYISYNIATVLPSLP